MKGYAVAPDCLGSGGNTSDRENLGAWAQLRPTSCFNLAAANRDRWDY